MKVDIVQTLTIDYPDIFQMKQGQPIEIRVSDGSLLLIRMVGAKTYKKNNSAKSAPGTKIGKVLEYLKKQDAPVKRRLIAQGTNIKARDVSNKLNMLTEKNLVKQTPDGWIYNANGHAKELVHDGK